MKPEYSQHSTSEITRENRRLEKSQVTSEASELAPELVSDLSADLSSDLSADLAFRPRLNYSACERFGQLTLKEKIFDSKPSIWGPVLHRGRWLATCDCGADVKVTTSQIARAMREANVNERLEMVASQQSAIRHDIYLWTLDQQRLGHITRIRRYQDPDAERRSIYLGVAYAPTSDSTDLALIRLACETCLASTRPTLRGRKINYPSIRKPRGSIKMKTTGQAHAHLADSDFGRLHTTVYYPRRGWLCLCLHCSTWLWVRYSHLLPRQGRTKCNRPCGKTFPEMDISMEEAPTKTSKPMPTPTSGPNAERRTPTQTKEETNDTV